MLLITLLVVILFGCGGSSDGGGGIGSASASASASATATATGGATTATTGGGGSGTLLYTLQWPISSREIPSYALSVIISVYNFGTTTLVDQKVVNRGGPLAHNTTVNFNLPPGKYTIVAEAKPNNDGGGDTIASDTVTSTVVNGQTTSTTLTFQSLVTKLVIDDLPAQANVGQNITVHAHAEDDQNNAILLPTDALDWSITSGGQFANMSSDGHLTLLSPGSVTIQVREIDNNITATKTITLVQGSTNGVIVIVS